MNTTYTVKLIQKGLTLFAIVSGPTAKGLRLKAPAMNEDVSPTIAALLGYECPGSWRGRSMVEAK